MTGTAQGEPPAPVMELGAITIDCADAAELAAFYCRALGVEGTERNGYHYLRTGDLLVGFRSDPDFRRPTWGPGTEPSGSVPMQMHFEMFVEDLDVARHQLEAIGAQTPDHQPELRTGLLVMLDPSGHPFCIFRRPAHLVDG